MAVMLYGVMVVVTVVMLHSVVVAVVILHGVMVVVTVVALHLVL